MYLYKVSIGNLGTIKFITAGCPPRWEIVRGQKDEFFLAEHHLYGSSRLGTKGYWQKEYNLKYIPGDAAHNQANLDASAFNYRRPWYSKVYNAMIEMQHTRPYGNEHTEQLYSNRLLGQKKYEISNHLGNVLAVVSDKEVDVPLNPITASSTSPEPLLEKKSGLYAAYDYYPFGMLMPDRFIQNEAPQCVWVSKNLYVKHLIDSWLLNLNDEADAAHFGPVGTTTMIYQPNSSEGNPGYISLTTTEPEMEVGVNVDLGTTAANKSIQVQFEVVTNGSNHMTMDLVQFNPLTAADEVLASYEVPADRQENFTVQAITVNNKPLRALLRSDGAGENSFRVHQARFTVVDEQIEPTLVEICNTDDFDSDYRFGFNGMEKDNEVKGIGNSLDFGARIYDSRLGKWLATDPLQGKYPSLSPYNFVGNMPIIAIDPDGKRIYIVSSNSNSREAIKLMRQTPKGRAIYNKYNKSTTQDIYIAVGSIPDRKNRNGETLDNILGTEFVTNGKIQVPKNHVLQEFKAFNGTSIAKSANRKKVGLVLLNSNPGQGAFGTSDKAENFLGARSGGISKNPYDRAETVFHEIVSHIDLAGAADEHDAYGNDKNGVMRKDWNPKKGSPAETIQKQLLELYEKKNPELKRLTPIEPKQIKTKPSNPTPLEID
jgi:RHS repeat-associated protein